MRTQLRTFHCVALLFLISCAPLSASAGLQLITAASPAVTAPPDGNGDSWSPIVTPDGRFVLFASTAGNLVLTASSNGTAPLNPPSVNVYLRDRVNQTTTLVSVNLVGTGGNGNSFPTALSTNGQFALFESAASDLVSNDTNNANDVFLRDVLGGVTSLVSVATNGACGNGVSRGSTLSSDGRFVAFTSAASNLTPDDTNGIPNVFVRDMQLDTTTLASAGAISDNRVASSSESPEITPDGRYVAFYSTATNLVPGVTTGSEIYVRDLQAGVTTWASTNARVISHVGANGFCCNHAISDNGQYVAFEICTNSNIPTNSFILYYNLQSGVTETVSTNAVTPMLGANQDKRSLSMTPDGRSIAYVAYTNNGTTVVYLWNASAGTNILVSTVTSGANVYWPDVDPTGRYVAFLTTDKNYAANTNAAVLLRDTLAGTTTLVSLNTNGSNLPVNVTAVPAMSASGGTVTFESPWANLDGRNFESDVFAFDLTNVASQLISVRDPSLASFTPNGPSSLWPGSLSANGRYIAFSTWANNVAPGDTNDCINVFVHDLLTGANVLVNVTSNGLPGNNLSTEPSISGDGRYVAFTSAATNLINGDNNSSSDVFVRDVQAGTTTLVSVSTNGTVGNGNSYLPKISSDGRYVLFCSAAQNLASVSAGFDNLYLRDLQLPQTYALTKGGFGSKGGFNSYAMTPDGNYVAFVGVISGTTNLYVWQTSTTALIYTNTSLALSNVSLSPDGHWLVYVAGTSLSAQDLLAGTNCLIATGSFGQRTGLKFSDDDHFLTYGANSNIYLYDFQSGSNLLVSTAYISTNAADGISDSPTISADGSFVAYRSFSTDAVPAASNGVPAILVFDLLTNSNLLASANLSGLSPAAMSLTPVFSADGQMLVFQSWASDLAPRDFNLGSDLFALDLFGLPGTITNPPPALSANIFEATGAPTSGPGPVPVISWPFDPAQSYSVQYKDNLTDPLWLPLSGTMTFIGNQAYLSDPAPSSPQRFYRIVQGN